MCDDIELKKLNLEAERLKLEEKKFNIENSFSNRHSGLLISSVISIGALILSVAQVWLTEINKDRDLEFAEIEKNERIELEKLKEDRRWRTESLKFFFENKEEVFHKELARRKRIKALILATFPKDHALVMFRGLADTAPNSHKEGWELAEKEAYEQITAKVYIHVKNKIASENLNKIKRQLRRNGYYVIVRFQNELPRKSDIRWYYKEDNELADQIIKKFKVDGVTLRKNSKFHYVTERGYDISHKTFEVWISED